MATTEGRVSHICDRAKYIHYGCMVALQNGMLSWRHNNGLN